MSEIVGLAEHLAPDSVRLLEQAAKDGLQDATCLNARGRRLAALYFLGYAVEMCLCAAYFRSVGFAPNTPIDRETRKRHMAHARQLKTTDGQPLMSSDPHPLVGWARYLKRQRELVSDLTSQKRETLELAVRRAERVYRHWRPELRYKLTTATVTQLAEVRIATEWFVRNSANL